jgi:hypothetical protein
MQAGLYRGIIKLFRNRRAILVAWFKSYRATDVIYTSDAINLYAKTPKTSRRGV